MNDFAYDISHLFDVETPAAGAPAPRMVRAVPPAPAAPPLPSGVAQAQEALARELMQSATIHDALVQQYLRMSGTTFRATYGG
ncbi:MAG: hypothetical protein ABI386_05600 [Rhodanobacter sp.]